jgi:hypothetical protein
MEHKAGGKGEDNEINNIEIHSICAGRGFNNMYFKLLTNGGGKEGRVMEGVVLIKVKYRHSRDTSRNSFEH